MKGPERAISDALEYGAFKQALTLCTKALKKQPNSAIYKVLHAQALRRSGKIEASDALVKEVVDSHPTEREVIDKLNVLFIEKGDTASCSLVFENAVSKAPNDLELVQKWFFAMNRLGNFSGQQRAATFLSKRSNNPEYPFWVVISLVLASKHSPVESERNLYSTLSVRMMEKLEQSGAIKTGEHFHLLLSVLLWQGEKKKATGLVQKDSYSSIIRNDVDLIRVRIDLLWESEQYTEVCSFCSEILFGLNLRDFKILSSFGRALAKTNPTQFSAYDQEIQKLQALCTSSEDRNSRLLQVEMAKLGLTPWNQAMTYIDSILQYFEQMADRNCCYEDLFPYCTNLNASERETLLGKIRRHCRDSNKGVLHPFEAINMLKFALLLTERDELDLKAFASDALKVYFSGKDALSNEKPTGPNAADEAMLLAALAHLARDPTDEHNVIVAIILLEAALSRTSYNHQITMFLVILFKRLGAFDCAARHYSNLEVKQIQHDTISHLLLSDVSSIYPSSTAISLLSLTNSIYQQNDEETPQMIKMAFEKGVYSHIEDFVELQNKLDKSVWREQYQTEIQRCRLLLSDSQRPSRPINLGCNDYTELRDNRDYSIVPFFHGVPGDFARNVYPRPSASRLSCRVASLVANVVHCFSKSLMCDDSVQELQRLRRQDEDFCQLKAHLKDEVDIIIEISHLVNSKGDKDRGHSSAACVDRLAELLKGCAEFNDANSRKGLFIESCHQNIMKLTIILQLANFSSQYQKQTKDIGQMIQDKLSSQQHDVLKALKARVQEELEALTISEITINGKLKELFPDSEIPRVIQGHCQKTIDNVEKSQRQVLTHTRRILDSMKC